MNRPLRTLHRHTFYAIAVVVPAVFILGISRRDPKQLEPLTKPLMVTANERGWPLGFLATSQRGETTVTRGIRAIRVPDPLLYCTNAATQLSDLPVDAVLVGPMREGTTLESRCSGRLILYSLGHRTVVDQLAMGGLR